MVGLPHPDQSFGERLGFGLLGSVDGAEFVVADGFVGERFELEGAPTGAEVRSVFSTAPLRVEDDPERFVDGVEETAVWADEFDEDAAGMVLSHVVLGGLKRRSIIARRMRHLSR